MRTRKPIAKSPLFTARANGEVIRHTEVKLSTHGRISQLCSALGIDRKQFERDAQWRSLGRQLKLQP